jgi:uncharacterized protein
MLDTSFSIDLPMLAAIAIVFCAAVVRGFSGFGFSLITITGLSLFYPPQDIIPPVFMMELAASINLLPAVWREVHWRTLVPLIIGAVIGTPLGVWFLSTMPAAPMQIALGVFVIASVWLLWIGYSLRTMPGRAATVAAGAASGLANGAFGIGGPPAILFYFASPAGNAAGRASLIVFFLATDIIGLALLSGMTSFVTSQTMIRALIYLPALLAGVWIGHRAFKGVDETKFRKAVLLLLAVMAIIVLAQGLIAFSN